MQQKLAEKNNFKDGKNPSQMCKTIAGSDLKDVKFDFIFRRDFKLLQFDFFKFFAFISLCVQHA